MFRLSIENRYRIFLSITLLTGLYTFEQTRWNWVILIMEYKIGSAPILSVKNLITVLLVYFFYKIFIAMRT